MARKKYSKSFERDWAFYLRCKDAFSFAGRNVPEPAYDPNGPDAKQAFLRYDAEGKTLPCREPALLKEIITCKASINLHIKMWAEGMGEGTFLPRDLRELACLYSPPRWVWEAMWRQAVRHDHPIGLSCLARLIECSE